MQAVPIIGISRHRISIDGPGITTLVCLHGCNLACKYCINPESKKNDKVKQYITSEELINVVKRDHLYYLATGGGICFGGGEPALHSSFIQSFKRKCDERWKISIETSLNVCLDNIKCLLPLIDHWIVDIKDMNPKIYNSYCQSSNNNVINNLHFLSQHVSEKVTIKVPLIPFYNNKVDQIKSREQLLAMGFKNIIQTEYLLA